MQVSELKKLSKNPALTKLYSFLFTLLYNGKESDFTYNKFTSVCFGKGAEDFQSRLATFDIKKLKLRPRLYDEFSTVGPPS